MVEGLKGGNEALDALHQIMSLDDVEKIMGDTEDAIAYQNVCFAYNRLIKYLCYILCFFCKNCVKEVCFV